MITKITTMTYFTSEKEMESNIESIEKVINAEVISFGKDNEGYFVEVEIKY